MPRNGKPRLLDLRQAAERVERPEPVAGQADEGSVGAGLLGGIQGPIDLMVALFESSLAQPPGSGLAWERLRDDTVMLRQHLEYLRDKGNQLPGDPTLVAAAMGGMLSMLAYAILPTDASGFTDEVVVDTVTDLLLGGLRGQATR